MATKKKNFTNQLTPKIIDVEYHNCNFTQKIPGEILGKKVGVRIFPGDDTPRTFVECNLTNCILPPGSTLIGVCNRTIAEIGIEQEKVKTKDEIVDGKEIEHFSTQYINKVHGRYKKGKAIYKDTIEESYSYIYDKKEKENGKIK